MLVPKLPIDYVERDMEQGHIHKPLPKEFPMKPRGQAAVLSLAIASLVMLASPTAQSQERSRPLDDWDYAELYQQGGMRAEALLDAKAISAEGETIGEVSNVILNEENKILTLVAEVGGMWDSGDRHVSVPWDEVELTEQGVHVPLHRDNIEEYSLFNDDYIDEAYLSTGELEQTTQVESDVMTGPRIWKITDILDEFVSLGPETGVGYVTDALFTREGVMQAIVIKPSESEFGNGPRAYPFYAYSDDWQPGSVQYELPYSREAIKELPEFDYEKYDSLWNE